MPKTAREKLKETAIRLDQSHRDGRYIMSCRSMADIINLMLQMIDEEK